MTGIALLDRQEAVRDLETRLRHALLMARLRREQLVSSTGRLMIVRLLAYGASGIVCEALDRRLGRKVALKLYPGLAQDALAKAVRTEAQILAALRHHNIVVVHDFDADDFRPGEIRCFFVAKELLSGTTLRHWMAESHTPSEVLDVFSRAGDGLAAAHAGGIIHRDFKPENVMFDRGGEPKLDFGLAILDSKNLEQRAIVGTLAYMAPEALRGHADARSDQFAFAAALWEAVYGEFPYPIDDLDPSKRVVASSAKLAKGVPSALFDCLCRALQADPARRFPRMTDLVAHLRMADTRTAAGARRETSSPPSPTSAENWAGARFAFEEMLGSGGYAEVFAATDTVLRRRVAIKLFKPGGTDISSPVAHAQALARIRHYNVVTVFEITSLPHPVDQEERSAIVMEYLEGPSLAEILRGPPLERARANELCAGIIAGLKALHMAGIVHYDLHDENIQLDASGVPKIIDVLYRGTLARLSQADRIERVRQDVVVAAALIGSILAHSSQGDAALNFRRLVVGAGTMDEIASALDRTVRLKPDDGSADAAGTQHEPPELLAPRRAASVLDVSNPDAVQGEEDKPKTIQYSRNMIGGQHDFGIVRVSRFRNEAKAHVFTARGWEGRPLDEEAERLILFSLSMGKRRQSLCAESVETRPKYRLEVHVLAGDVECDWLSFNDVGEQIRIDRGAIPLSIRCDLLAACAIRIDE